MKQLFIILSYYSIIMDITTLSEQQYDDLLTDIKSRSELTDDTLLKYLYPEQKWLTLSGASFTLTDITCENMIKIINKESFVKFQVYNIRHITPYGYKLLFNHFTNITCLNIGCARKMDQDSFASLKNLSKLKTLVLNGNDFITDDVIIPNLPYWPELTDLSIRCRNITDKTILAIAENCPNLVILDIGRCFGLSSNSALIELSQKCKKINHLNICALKFLDDNTLFQITSNLDLKHLDIISCIKLTELGVMKCLPNLKDIIYFRLMECSNELIMALSKNCHKLKNIYIPKSADVDEYSICQVLDNCPDLINIFISQSDDLSNNVLKKILARKNLEELHIDGIIHFVDEMTFEPFATLDHKLENLRVLSIKERPEVINDEGVIHIGKACPNLEVFDIRQAMQLTHLGYVNIARYFGNLKSLNLKRSGVTNQDIEVLSNGCKNIEILILACCSKLTPKVIEISFCGFNKLNTLIIAEAFQKEPSEYNEKLEKINVTCVSDICISDNIGVDDNTLNYILDCCPKLNRLNIANSPNILTIKEDLLKNENLFIIK